MSSSEYSRWWQASVEFFEILFVGDDWEQSNPWNSDLSSAKLIVVVNIMSPRYYLKTTKLLPKPSRSGKRRIPDEPIAARLPDTLFAISPSATMPWRNKFRRSKMKNAFPCVWCGAVANCGRRASLRIPKRLRDAKPVDIFRLTTGGRLSFFPRNSSYWYASVKNRLPLLWLKKHPKPNERSQK